jgi:hypothetical protein
MTANIATTQTIAEREKLCRDAVYALPRIAMVGQFTVIYAAPNTGKTLISLWLMLKVKEEDIIPIFLNADDTYEGATEKARLLKDSGVIVLTPNDDGFKPSDFPQIIDDLIQDGDARKVVLLLDTVKQFTSLMNKTEAAEFGQVIRRFVENGGTAIALAHTNKHKDGEGKSISAGTSDLTDDCDAAYVVELNTAFEESQRQVTFENRKSRGPNAQKVAFTYSAASGLSWTERFNSVAMIENDQAQDCIKANEAKRQYEADKGTIEFLRNLLPEDRPVSSSALIRGDLGGATPSSRERTRVLKRYDQSHEFPEYLFWRTSRGPKGGEIYTLNHLNTFR